MARRATTMALIFTLAAAGSALAQEPGSPGEPSPAMANDWSCKPSTAHPRPVVLVHGLGSTMAANWSYMSPRLASAGYCVFALTYGRDPRYGPYSSGGLTRMQDSAQELKAFVDRVKTETGAAKVDIVGHSEGTMMPRWYLERLGGAPSVQNFVALAPLWRGTTGYGYSGVLQSYAPYCGACPQLAAGSDYLNDLNAGGEGIPGVKITSIATRNDELVTPYTSGFNADPSATNILLQDVCAADPSEHLALAFDPIVEHLVRNALDPTTATPAGCTG